GCSARRGARRPRGPWRRHRPADAVLRPRRARGVRGRIRVRRPDPAHVRAAAVPRAPRGRAAARRPRARDEQAPGARPRGLASGPHRSPSRKCLVRRRTSPGAVGRRLARADAPRDGATRAAHGRTVRVRLRVLRRARLVRARHPAAGARRRVPARVARRPGLGAARLPAGGRGARGELRGAPRPAGDGPSGVLRPGAEGPHRQRARAVPRLPRDGPAARRHGRSRRRLHRPAQPGRGLARARDRRPARPGRCGATQGRAHGAPPRRREGQDLERDHQQAGRADRRGARGHQHPHDRGRAHARPGRRAARRDRPPGALMPRALGRARLPRRARGRGEPARGADRVCVRRVQRHDDDAIVPTGHVVGRGPGGATPLRRHAVRPAGRRGARDGGRRRAGLPRRRGL
ncbi:MAG: hypothetical protein AVDCRST_MAG79-2755, partial [uncultured Thermoleophilia bacterium]